MTIWRFHLLGKQFVVDPRGRTVRLPALAWPALGLLLAAPGRRLARSSLGGLLWPEVEEAVARHRLATVVWRLRRSLASFDDFIITTDEDFAVASARNIWIDSLWLVQRCERVLAAPRYLDRRIERLRLLRALRLYEGAFLAQHDQEALLIERERIRALYLDAGHLLGNAHLRHGEHSAVIEICRTLCAEEPLREDLQRLLIAALDDVGQRPLAIQQYHRLETLLRREIGVAPMPETRALYEGLFDRSSSTETASAYRPNIEQLTAPSPCARAESSDSQRWLLERLHAQVKGSLSLIENALGY